jgi:serine/threonine protein phosphatase 1
MKIAVIGDIHGCYKQLLELLTKLPSDIDQIYSTGDLIDRGPDSDKVVQEVINRGIAAVKGNHEEMCLDYVMNIGEYDRGIFEMNGGDKTLKSYNNNIPEEHLDFMADMPHFIETDDFIITHAGINTFVKDTFRDGSDNSNRNILWQRENICGNLGKIQIFGHTPQHHVHLIKRGGVVDAINVDTGCVFGYRLSAIILPDMEVITVDGYKRTEGGW